ncbi:hypothetical protein RQP46_008838 [Phenoliferia psychrophenolica]
MAHASTSRWSLDYSSAPSKVTVTSPPGYTPALTKSKGKNSQALVKAAEELSALRQQKAWDLALAPAKNVPMQAFMMYMTGGGVQIFSVMSVWTCLKGAVTGMMGVEQAFAPFASTTDSATPASFALQKATFIACQVGLLAVGLWKCHSMGLLPSHDSDWLAFQPAPVWEEATKSSYDSLFSEEESLVIVKAEPTTPPKVGKTTWTTDDSTYDPDHERKVRPYWTPEEENVLEDSIAIKNGKFQDWVAIAVAVSAVSAPGVSRNAKSCRKKYARLQQASGSGIVEDENEEDELQEDELQEEEESGMASRLSLPLKANSILMYITVRRRNSATPFFFVGVGRRFDLDREWQEAREDWSPSPPFPVPDWLKPLTTEQQMKLGMYQVYDSATEPQREVILDNWSLLKFEMRYNIE